VNFILFIHALQLASFNSVIGTSRPKYRRQRRNRRQSRKTNSRRTSSKKRQRTVQNFKIQIRRKRHINERSSGYVKKKKFT